MTEPTTPSRPRWPRRIFVTSMFLLDLGLLAGVLVLALQWNHFGPDWNAPKLPIPLVVIESDDWGLDYEPPRFVPPSPQLDARQTAGVQRLAAVLRKHKDSAGRAPVASMFIVVRQADTPAIAADAEFAYHFIPIDKSMPKTVAALKQAESEGLLDLVYHGRDHRDVGLWCQKVRRAVEAARTAGTPFDPGVVATFHPADDPREQDRCIAEYFDSREGYLQPLDAKEIDKKIRTGLAEFERIFGRRPTSTVPPRYLWGPRAETALARHGIRTIHGANKQGGRFRDDPDVWTRSFGVRMGPDLVGIPRTVDVEVSRDGKAPPLAEVMAWADKAVEAGQPIVICTHHCNYASAGDEGDRMAACLDGVLSALEAKYPTLRYLSAEEAGTLAAEGLVTLQVAPPGQREIRAASGAAHAWLWAKGVYARRAKVKLYARGMAGLFVLTVLTGALALRARPRARRGERAGAEQAE